MCSFHAQEEEKRQKRIEKMKQERERRLQHEAELQEKENQKRKERDEEESKIPEMNKNHGHQPPVRGVLDKKQMMDPKRKLEILLESTIPKASSVTAGANWTTPTKQDHTQR